jgi:hypothetical protein
MNVRYFHLRAAKLHILFLITKFIFNFIKNIFSPTSLNLQPQITGCKCNKFFLIPNSFFKVFLNDLYIRCKVLIY